MLLQLTISNWYCNETECGAFWSISFAIISKFRGLFMWFFRDCLKEVLGVSTETNECHGGLFVIHTLWSNDYMTANRIRNHGYGWNVHVCWKTKINWLNNKSNLKYYLVFWISAPVKQTRNATQDWSSQSMTVTSGKDNWTCNFLTHVSALVCKTNLFEVSNCAWYILTVRFFFNLH